MHQLLQINWEDPGVFAILNVTGDDAVTQETLQAVDENLLDLFKFESGKFYRALISSEEQEVDGEEKMVYELDGWEEVK